MRIVHLSTQLNIQRIVTSISSSKSAMMVGIIVKFSLSYYTFYVIETADGCTLGDLLSFFTGSSMILPQAKALINSAQSLSITEVIVYLQPLPVVLKFVYPPVRVRTMVPSRMLWSSP